MRVSTYVDMVSRADLKVDMVVMRRCRNRWSVLEVSSEMLGYKRIKKYMTSVDVPKDNDVPVGAETPDRRHFSADHRHSAGR